MAKQARVERGLYRLTNKDGSIKWMIDYLNPEGKRIRKTFKTKKQAVEERAKRVSMMAEGEYAEFVEKKEIETTTFNDLIELYNKNYQDQVSFKTAKKYYMERFIEFFGGSTLLSNIEYGHLKNYRNKLIRSLNQHGRTFKPSSINKEIRCLHHMFEEAREYNMVDRNPFNDGKKLHLEENNEREVYLTPEEARILFNECPLHLQQIVECALYTGMRRAEIFTLKWHQIRNGWIILPKTKSGKKQRIPISITLEKLFDRIKASQSQEQDNVFDMKGKRITGIKSDYVFSYNGKPIKDCKTAFIKACERAGIPYGRNVPNGITFHDLRHSYGSYVQQQTDFRTTQELMRHEDPKMTKRYTHSDDDRRKLAVNSIDWNLH